jgi:phage virion morphogenesis protein
MAGLVISLELEENISAALGRTIAAGADLTPAMQDIANHLALTTSKRFEDERGPDGKPWKPSKRVLDNPGEKTLQLSGDLKNSIRPDWDRDYAAAGPEASGGAAIYAAIHQLGGTIRPKVKKALSFGGRIVASVTIPAREYLGFDEVNRRTIVEILREHLGDALGGRGA